LTREKKIAAFALLSVAGTYVALAIHLSSAGVFWSPDSGARFAMIRNWIEYGSLTHLHYPSASVDPTGQIHPLGYFLFRQRHCFTAMYPPLFPLLCGLLYRAFGFIGLTVIPLLSGLGTAAVLYVTARRLQLCASVLLIAVGFGTPLLIYSVVFWDHVVMMLLTALAAFWMLRSLQDRRLCFPLLAGAVLGLGVWIHELMLALSLAVFSALLPLARDPTGRRMGLALFAGFLPPVLLWVGVNWLIYGSLGGPHLSANLGGNAQDHPFDLNLILDSQQIKDRAFAGLVGITSTGMMLNGSHVNLIPLFLVLACLLVGYWVLAMIFGMEWRLAPLAALVIASLAVYLVEQVHWANGLFQATPLFIPALAVSWDSGVRPAKSARGETNPESWALPSKLFYAWVSRSVWLYVLIVLIYPSMPGVDWGSRYLLPVLPFLSLLAVHAVAEQYQASGPRWRHVILGCAASIVGISIFCQGEGLMMIQRSTRYHEDLARRISGVTSPALVFSNIGTGADLAAVPLRQSQFMVRSEEDLRLLLVALGQQHIRNFTYVGSDGGLTPLDVWDVSAPSGERLKRVDSQWFHVDQTREDGGDLQFVHFVSQGHPLLGPK